MELKFKNKFIKTILSNQKIHTIRQDLENEWKSDSIINVVNEQNEQFTSLLCTGTQKIEIETGLRIIEIKIDDKPIMSDILPVLIKNDGFKKLSDFYYFFESRYGGNFSGKIVHWTDFRY